ncbi:hypothetical protein ESCO_003983 [Escovopsis weberi]|uniref:Carcinoembryonic antigen-related cell adhesion molecule 1 n=1 Tax=Escovopsis weberi TaxID=150374 RepID=A0A0M8N4W8_ESCWE|nr:hypothetical protein ESCO_003983 [Escovopsis weberi]
MIPSDLTRSSPTTTALLILLSSLPHLAASYRIPRETKTVDFRELNVVDFPLVAATPAPTSPSRQPQRRGFNTVCGYIGGDAAFPATCMAGSHCVLEVDHGAIGCCPDGGTCTEGIFTGCVDFNSPPQTELNPYVFTCTGSEVCYKNDFEGGYYQYGCGTASRLATLVATSALRSSSLELNRITMAFTAKPTPLATPTALGTRSHTEAHETTTGISAATATSASTGSAASHTDDAAALPASTKSPEAPDKEAAAKSSSSIVGGVVGGVVGALSLFVVIAMFIFFFKRRAGGEEHPTSYITPAPEKDGRFRSPTPSQLSFGVASAASTPRSSTQRPIASLSQKITTQKIATSSNLSAPAKTISTRPSDEIPLAKEGEKPENGTAPVLPADEDLDPYPGPRRGGGGSFWAQTRSTPRSRDRSWARG